MKKSLFILIIVALASCGKDQKAKILESYVCTNNGITSDHNFKIKYFKEIDPITATDSMIYLMCDTIPTKYYWSGDTVHFTYPDSTGSLKLGRIQKFELDNAITSWIAMQKNYEKEFDEMNTKLLTIEILIEKDETNPAQASTTAFIKNHYEHSLKATEKAIKFMNETLSTLKSAKKYSLLPSETILLRAFNCTYTIINPELKIKQTQTQTFYFNNDLTKVVASLGIKK
jgi:hypothetical protein